MRKLLSLFLLLLICISCAKYDTPPWFTLNYWGEASSKKNGVDWEGYVNALVLGSIHDCTLISISIETYSKEWYHRELLSFSYIPINTKRHFIVGLNYNRYNYDSLPPSGNYITSLDDGDVAGPSYDLLEEDSISDYIEITNIDGDEITGVFQASFVKDSLSLGIRYSNFPDTIRFLKGHFHTKILCPY